MTALPGMHRLPGAIRDAMRAAGASATCLPVRLDAGHWEAALFIQVAGPECKEDRRALRHAAGPLPVGLETDLIGTDHGTVIVLRAEVHARPGDPFASEILLTPGAGGAHFEALGLLREQARLCWYFVDQRFEVIHAQAHELEPAWRSEFASLRAEALRRDATVRLTARYDAQAALGEVARHYELRAGIAPGPALAPPPPAGRPS